MNLRTLIPFLALIGCYTAPADHKTPSDGVHFVDNPGTPGVNPTDKDGDDDGFLTLAAGGDDCNDSDPAVHPGAEELCDNVDQNCNHVVDEAVYMCEYSDNDFDGFTPRGGDCDDYNALANPDQVEQCNGFDDDCDGEVDESHTTRVAGNECGQVDADGDGVLTPTDCNDSDPNIRPGVVDNPYDGIDQDCSGGDLIDVDGDTFSALVAGGSDCDDTDNTVNPRATEAPGNGKDDDCDPATSDTLSPDADGDGVTVGAGDCNDAADTTYPGAPELCDGEDNDCDGVPDDGVVNLDWYLDADGDGHGDAGDLTPTSDCSQPAGRVSNRTDCDDSDSTISPDASEIAYNAVDENCDGLALVDVDCDTWEPPLDCDDTEALAFPGNPEVLNDGIDNDCDPATLDSILSCAAFDINLDGTVFFDQDDDEFGNGLASTTVAAGDCTTGSWSDVGTDCDDGHDTAFPGGTEILDGLDNDCLNGVDDGFVTNQLCLPVTAPVTGEVDVYVFETVTNDMAYWVERNTTPVVPLQSLTAPDFGVFASGDASAPICGDFSRIDSQSGDRILFLGIWNDGSEQPLVTGDAGIGYTSSAGTPTLDGVPFLNCMSTSASACAAPYGCTECIIP